MPSKEDPSLQGRFSRKVESIPFYVMPKVPLGRKFRIVEGELVAQRKEIWFRMPKNDFNMRLTFLRRKSEVGSWR